MASTSDKSTTIQTQFYLRWNNHMNNLLHIFMEQLTGENLVDVTISCEGKFIKAHKMVLSACSPYFQELFKIHEVSHPVIIMNGVKFVDVKQIIEFMYQGEVKVLEAELDSFLAVAETLQVKGLSNVRSKYQKGDINNATETSEKSEKNNEKEPSLPEPKKRKLDNVNSVLPNKKEVEAIPVKEIEDIPAGLFYPVPCEVEVAGNEEIKTDIKVEPPDIEEVEVIDPLSDSDHAEENNVKIDLPKPKRRIRIPDSIKLGGISKPHRKSYNLPTVKTFVPSDIDKPPRANVIKPDKPPKIPRPPNAFMIFANKWRKTLANLYQNESNAEISCRLGNMWKGLEKDDKETYYKAARQADQEHKEKYPDYYYSPQEARQRKYSQQLRNAIEAKTALAKNNPVQFVQVYMAGKNDTTTPVMIALGNPEVSVQIDKTFSIDQKDWDDNKKIEIKEEVIDSSIEDITKDDSSDVESTSKEDSKK